MYFIRKGVVKVLANDNKTTLAFMGEGSYFGEIGVLITKKRTVSVKAKTICIFFTIPQEELIEILEAFPV
jgi:CRP-like cAMP-binding protein